jgi:hypothetical protein
VNKEESIKHIRKMLGDDLYIKKEILYYIKSGIYVDGDIPVYVSTFEYDGIKVRIVHHPENSDVGTEWIKEIRVSRRHNSSWDKWRDWDFRSSDAVRLCEELNPPWKKLPGKYIQHAGKRGIVLSVPKYGLGYSEVLWDGGKIDDEVNTLSLTGAEVISESW